MKNIFKLLIIISALAVLTACTKNERTRNFGGDETIKIAANEKLVNITWKENDIWIITQDTITGNYYAKEKSAWGLLQGKITIIKDK